MQKTSPAEAHRGVYGTVVGQIKQVIRRSAAGMRDTAGKADDSANGAEHGQEEGCGAICRYQRPNGAKTASGALQNRFTTPHLVRFSPAIVLLKLMLIRAHVAGFFAIADNAIVRRTRPVFLSIFRSLGDS